MKLSEWLEKHPHGEFRSGMYAPASPAQGPQLGKTPFKIGDVLCVPHGPWMYLFGTVSIDADGSIHDHELLSAH